DSRGGGSTGDLQRDQSVVRAVHTGRPTHGTVEDDGEHYAEAVVPILRGQYFLVLRRPVENRSGAVEVVQHRLVLAAAVALAIALLLGYLGARMFARRIKRLERAARPNASGRL